MFTLGDTIVDIGDLVAEPTLMEYLKKDFSVEILRIIVLDVTLFSFREASQLLTKGGEISSNAAGEYCWEI